MRCFQEHIAEKSLIRKYTFDIRCVYELSLKMSLESKLTKGRRHSNPNFQMPLSSCVKQ